MSDIRAAAVQALTDEQIDRALSAIIPGGSQARDWFLPHEHEKGLANVRDVVRRMFAALQAAPAPMQPTDDDEAFRQFQRDRIAEAQRYDIEQAKPRLAAAPVQVEPTAVDAPSLSAINKLAKVYCTSYASPHHITFTVEGLRNLFAALQADQQEARNV